MPLERIANLVLNSRKSHFKLSGVQYSLQKLSQKNVNVQTVLWNRRKLSAKKAELDTHLCVVVSVFLTQLHILHKLTFVVGLLQSFRAGRSPVVCVIVYGILY